MKDVTIHKWYVLLFGIELKVPLWRLVIHDFRKFHPKNFIPYTQRFFGDSYDEDEFEYVWLDHQNTCQHHWEYWITRSSNAKSPGADGFIVAIPLRMPMWAVREMVADWLAASKAYAGIEVTSLTSWVWYQKNYPNIQKHLHEDTVTVLANVLVDYLLGRSTKHVNNTT